MNTGNDKKTDRKQPQPPQKPAAAPLTGNEKIDRAAADILNRYRKAFEELAK